MPGDPAMCRLIAERYVELCERAKDPVMSQGLCSLADTWTKLAAELEFDQALLNTLSKIQFEPIYATPGAPNLRAA